MANPGKEKKGKEAREEGNVLRRLLEEVASLRSEVESIKSSPGAKSSASERLLPFSEDFEPAKMALTDPQKLGRVEDSVVARLAYAFASPQKVKIVRILLMEGPLSSAQIGERCGLTTGSLYHHLRELTHAEVIEPAGRNLHTITEYGRQAAICLFQLAR